MENWDFQGSRGGATVRQVYAKMIMIACEPALVSFYCDSSSAYILLTPSLHVLLGQDKERNGRKVHSASCNRVIGADFL